MLWLVPDQPPPEIIDDVRVSPTPSAVANHDCGYP